MKKIVKLFFILATLICVVGCASTNVSQQNIDRSQQESSKPKEIILTTENILSYLAVDLNVVEVKETPIGRWESKEAHIEINTYPKVHGSFENVSVSVEIDSDTRDWQTKNEHMATDRRLTLTIPMDGRVNKKLTIDSHVSERYIWGDPEFKVKINAVSGKFIEQ